MKSEYFAIKNNVCISIDDVKIDTTNGYKYFKKDNKLYIKIYNEVATPLVFDKLKSMIFDVLKGNIEYRIEICDSKVYPNGTDRNEFTMLKCKIPDGDIFEVRHGKYDLGFTFEVLEII